MEKTVGDLGAVCGIVLASIAFVMELALTPLILAEIQQDLALSLGQLSWVFNVCAAAVAVTVLTTGLIGDLVVKRALFSAGVSLFLIGSGVSAVSVDLDTLIFGRVLQGAGGGLFSPLVPILLTQAFPHASGRILMIWGGLAGVVATASPTFGDVLLTIFGWRAVFWTFALVAFLSLVLSARGRIADRQVDGRAKPNYRALLGIRAVWLLLLFVFLTYGCFTFFLFDTPIRMEQNGFSTKAVAWVLTVVWFAFAAFSFILRDRLDGSSVWYILLLSPMFLASGFLLVLLFVQFPVALCVGAVMVGAGLACFNSPTTYLMLKLTPPDLHAFVSSLDITCARCGGVVAVALLSGMGANNVAVFVVSVAFAALAVCRLIFGFSKNRAELN